MELNNQWPSVRSLASTLTRSLAHLLNFNADISINGAVLPPSLTGLVDMKGLHCVCRCFEGGRK